MKEHRQCIICHSRTQELDATGRCGSCAAVLRAKRLNLTYGNLIAVEDHPEPKKQEPEKAICKFCGRPFVKNNPLRMYCNDSCKSKAQHRRAVLARG